MTVTMTATTTPEQLAAPLIGQAAPSPAGPAAEGIGHLRQPPEIPLSPTRQTLRFSVAPDRVRLRGPPPSSARSSACARAIVDGGPVVTSHPDHVKALFTAKPCRRAFADRRVAAAPGRRPQLRAHLGGRPPPAPAQAAAAALPRRRRAPVRRTSSRRPPSARSTAGGWASAFALAPRMQAVTLDVIMAGLRHRGPGRAGPARGAAAQRHQALRGIDEPGRPARRVDQHRPRRAGRACPSSVLGWLDRPSTP